MAAAFALLVRGVVDELVLANRNVERARAEAMDLAHASALTTRPPRVMAGDFGATRGSDVLVLAHEFLRKIAERTKRPVHGIAADAARKLVAYSWPGNVRELVNAMERAVALAEYDDVTVGDLPEKIQAFRRSHIVVSTDDPSELLPLDEVERRYILRVIDAVGGNRTRAAEILKVDRKTLYTKLKSYGWRPSEAPPGAGG